LQLLFVAQGPLEIVYCVVVLSLEGCCVGTTCGSMGFEYAVLHSKIQ